MSNSQATTTCTATGFSQDGNNLTAAQIDPKGTVTGDVDATGCNIGIYYGPGNKGKISGANIHGANYFGVVNNGGNVTISDSTISDIGETPFNGTQHGVAIYFAIEGGAKGEIKDNVIWNYQKGGITVTGPGTSAEICNNTVVGLGPVNFIAQNGIEIGFGADADAIGNFVVGNSYTGSGQTASGGILVVGGPCYGTGRAFTVGSHVTENTSIGNDVGIWFSNLDASCAPPTTTPTKDVASKNMIRNNAINNTSGNGVVGQGYQAGIADQGDGDVIEYNNICGKGYTPVTSPPPYLYTIDVTDTTSPVVKNNKTCGLDPVTGEAPDLPTPPAPSTTSSRLVLPSVIQ